jgi:hypothetical protein
MSSFLTTFIIACVLVALAFVGLLIGWFITGKPFQAKSCGGGLKRFQNGKCGKNIECELCSKPKKQDKAQKN